MPLSYLALKAIVKHGVITNVTDDLINGTSIDLTLGRHLLVERGAYDGDVYTSNRISLRDKNTLPAVEVDMGATGYYILRPGQFVLAHSEQLFNLPAHLSAEYKLKSSMARIGLEHLNAGWCDPGWHGSALTLELKNMTQHTEIVLRVGDRIGQVIFWPNTPVPVGRGYDVRGRYNGDTKVSGAKPDPVGFIDQRCSLCGGALLSNGTCSFVECKDPLHDKRTGLWKPADHMDGVVAHHIPDTD